MKTVGGDESSASHFSCFTYRGAASINKCTGGWMGPLADLDIIEKRIVFLLPGIQSYSLSSSP
jgi:hypothetical protein